MKKWEVVFKNNKIVRTNDLEWIRNLNSEEVVEIVDFLYLFDEIIDESVYTFSDFINAFDWDECYYS